MAAPVNTQTTVTAIGNRESLEDIIYKVSPENTPFTASIGNVTVKAKKHEWQTHTLRAAATNAQAEGDDVGTYNAATVTARVGNYCQIMSEDFVVSGTQEAVDAAGRASEIALQKTTKAKELLNDFEKACLSNTASSGSDPRYLGGALAWIETNDSRGSGGSDGGFNAGTGVVDAATNGTQRALTETLFKNVLATCFNAGAKPNMALMSITHKQIVSNFTGNATNFNTALGNIQATAGFYISDAGKIELVPTQSDHGLSRDILFIDKNLWAIGTLRPLKTTEMAKTGDNMKFQSIMEKTLICKNEKGNGVLADLTTTGV